MTKIRRFDIEADEELSWRAEQDDTEGQWCKWEDVGPALAVLLDIIQSKCGLNAANVYRQHFGLPIKAWEN
jgi:hypothetical protein